MQARFWNKVDKSGDCWEWKAHRSRAGYGRIGVNGKARDAHRLSYEMEYGEIPDGLCVLHTCDNRGCVNPDHLWLGTKKDNNRDAMLKGRNAHGSRHPRAKLCNLDVWLIRELSLTQTGKDIAEWFGIHKGTVSNIKNNKRWTHAL